MKSNRPPWQVCAHDGTFSEHCCWAITDKSLEHEETEDKFCQAKVDGVIRRFDHPLMGFMEVKNNDWMIPVKCSGCDDVVLLRVSDERLCGLCRDKRERHI